MGVWGGVGGVQRVTPAGDSSAGQQWQRPLIPRAALSWQPVKLVCFVVTPAVGMSTLLLCNCVCRDFEGTGRCLYLRFPFRRPSNSSFSLFKPQTNKKKSTTMSYLKGNNNPS